MSAKGRYFKFDCMSAFQQSKLRIVVADDHLVLLEGLVSLLRSENKFNEVAQATGGKELISLLANEDFDVCLLDISMPGMDGMEAAKWIRENKLSIKIIVLTTHDEEEIIAEMIQIGADGYLLKSCTRQELLDCISRVAAGKNYFSGQVSDSIIQSYSKQLKKQHEAATPLLTPRETEIIRLLADEYTNERIARQLNITYRTVETHRKNIMQKTKAANLAGLIKFAYTTGLITK